MPRQPNNANRERLHPALRYAWAEADAYLQKISGGRLQLWLIQADRSAEQHAEYLSKGRTKVSFEDTKHNADREGQDGYAWAMDVAVFDTTTGQVQWGDLHKRQTLDGRDMAWRGRMRFAWLAGFLAARVEEAPMDLHGLALRWGGDWDQDMDFTDQTFDDLVHFELAEARRG